MSFRSALVQSPTVSGVFLLSLPLGIPPQSLPGRMLFGAFRSVTNPASFSSQNLLTYRLLFPSLPKLSDHQMLKMHLRVQSRFHFEFFTLFCNGFTTFSASKSADEEAELVESVESKSTRYKNKWAYGIFEQWQKERLIKLPNVQSQWFVQRYYNFHLAQIYLIEMNVLSLNYWFSKFVQEVAKSISSSKLSLSPKNSAWYYCRHFSISGRENV